MPETPATPDGQQEPMCGAFLTCWQKDATHVRVISREGKTVLPKTPLVRNEGTGFQLVRLKVADLPALALFSTVDGRDVDERTYYPPDRTPPLAGATFFFEGPAVLNFTNNA